MNRDEPSMSKFTQLHQLLKSIDSQSKLGRQVENGELHIAEQPQLQQATVVKKHQRTVGVNCKVIHIALVYLFQSSMYVYIHTGVNARRRHDVSL